jgi:hypothetical protein
MYISLGVRVAKQGVALIAGGGTLVDVDSV